MQTRETRSVPLIVHRERDDGTIEELKGALNVPVNAPPELYVDLGNGIKSFRIRAEEIVNVDAVHVAVANDGSVNIEKTLPARTVNTSGEIEKIREIPVEVNSNGESFTELFDVPHDLPDGGKVPLRVSHTNGQAVVLWLPAAELRDAQKLRVNVQERDGADVFGVSIVSTDATVPVKLLESELRREFKKGQLAAFAGIYAAGPNNTLPTRGDQPSQVVLADESVSKLAEAFKELPTPQVTVNVDNDDEPQTITFQRDPQGRIESAEIE